MMNKAHLINILAVICITMLLIACSGGSFNSGFKESKKDENKSESSKTDDNEKKPEDVTTNEEDIVNSPVNISGSWLTCGYFSRDPSQEDVQIGCGVYVDNEKSDLETSDWKIEVIRSDVSETPEITLETAGSAWHVTFKLATNVLNNSFNIKVSVTIAGEAKEETISSADILGTFGLLDFSVVTGQTYDNVSITVTFPKETNNFVKVKILEIAGAEAQRSCEEGALVREYSKTSGFSTESFEYRPSGSSSVFSYLVCIEDSARNIAPWKSVTDIAVGAKNYRFVIDSGSTCATNMAQVLVYINELQLKWNEQIQINAIEKIDATNGEGLIGGILATVKAANVWNNGNCSGYDCSVWRMFDGDSTRDSTRNYASTNSFSVSAPYDALKPTYFDIIFEKPIRLQGYRLVGSAANGCYPTRYHVETDVSAQGNWSTVSGSEKEAPSYPEAVDVSF